MHTVHRYSDMIMVAAIHMYESERAASRHGLFMGYVAWFLHVFSYAFSVLSFFIFLSSSSFLALPFRMVYFLLLRLSSCSLPLSAQSFFRPHSTICEERAVEEHVFYVCSYRLFHYQRMFPRDILHKKWELLMKKEKIYIYIRVDFSVKFNPLN